MTSRFCRGALAASLLALVPATQAALDVAGLAKDVNACTDLYGYANRQWLQDTAIPDDRASWGTGTAIAKRNEELLRTALEEGMQNLPPAGSAQRKAVDFYASGMDTNLIGVTSLMRLWDFQTRAGSVTTPESLAVRLAFFHPAGMRAGFQFSVQPDPKDSASYLAKIEQDGLGLPDRDYYFRDDDRSKKIREAYRGHIERMFILFENKPELAKKNAATILDMETALAKASMTAVEVRDDEKTYNKMTLEQLEALGSGFPWRTYFKELGAPKLETLNVAQPEFMKAFAEMAAKRTSDEWRVYLRWTMLRAVAPTLPADFEQESFAFNSTELLGIKAPPSRSRKVIDMMNGRYGDAPMAQALGQIYVEKAFPASSKARALELVQNVQGALGARLKQVDWMSEATRTKAIEKLSAMRVKIGYPDTWRDYTDAKIEVAPFMVNWVEANRFEHRRQLARLGKPVDRGDWWMAPQMVNAYYDPNLNEIVFPAGILQPPMFDAKADDPLNYGGIGTVIGHEITHGFDDSGRKYDAQGNLKDWWTAEDAKRYEERAQRMVKQFDAYVGVEGLHLNGALTLGENVSDLGGVKLAYLALQSALAKSKKMAKVDDLTPDQRFFLAYAQAWRRLDRPERERLIIQTDGHSPARFRVRGPSENLPEFAKAFSCDAAKTLRPEADRPNIW
ncbi:hypothetical protein BWI17_14845 [Betaproteobacteria bacterium GR16-43]|nr:hypothetical protein BWI17_14845 [Betaproteobacteria bacterium GR16-43]